MKNSKIEWTDHTFNPWIGCTKVSPGCQHCYAEALMDGRFGRVKWGPQGARVRTSAANWRKPLAWDKRAKAEGRRFRVFCASLADMFERKEDQELDVWRDDLFSLIERTPNLDWLILTKRPENIAVELGCTGRLAGDWLPRHPSVWIGTSVENQAQADIRIPELLRIPAAVRFLSIEPLLGPVSLAGFDGKVYRPWLDSHAWAVGIGWVIVGGESGPNARPMRPDWVRSLRDQCQAAGVPFLFKQWGEWLPCYQPGANYNAEHTMIGDYAMAKVGKHAAGRLLDGREWNEYPESALHIGSEYFATTHN